MFEIQYPPPLEKVVLAGLYTPDKDPILFEEDMQEMVMLCRTAGAEVMEVVVQKAAHPHASTYLGSGKIEHIGSSLARHGCETLIIDAELSPGQIRNIEKKTNAKVIDRSQLILDIFALHARTNEARIQVELAQLRTLYPRLTHAWSHFSQQVGGIGTRGPGEKQLEVDRRLIQKKIADLNKKLHRIEASRRTQRKRSKGLLRLALVGYTNVGKSSLLNSLSNAHVLVENKLFATLDTSSRTMFLPGIGEVIISDTVGFLRKLPHHLVASFKSTLEVVRDADILLIIMDASSRWSDQQYATVISVLSEIGAVNPLRQIIFNKVDLVDNPFTRKKIELAFPGSLMVSAFDKEDMKCLKQHIGVLCTDLLRFRNREEAIKKEMKKNHSTPDQLLYR